MGCEHQGMNANEMRELAAGLFHEHGPAIFQVVLRTSAEHACAGHDEGARFWRALSLILDDIICSRIDPDRPITLH